MGTPEGSPARVVARCLAIASLATAVLMAGCTGSAETAERDAALATHDPSLAEQLEDREAVDLGEDWARADGAGSFGNSRAPGDAPAAHAYWAILLRTFTGEGHAAVAGNARASVAALDERFAPTYVRSDERGSRVLLGAFDRPEDETAQRELTWVKVLNVRGRPIFPQAMLVRVEADGPQSFGANDLRSARARHPNVNPLYTLQVAVWGAFDGGQLTPEERHRLAQAHTRKLRTTGHEAYYYHDDDLALSMVTVGLFGASAIDPQSGILSPEVEQLMREFPAHLVNGEVLREPIHSRYPERGTRIQGPRLVLVPK